MSRRAWGKLLAVLRPLKGWQAVPAAFLAIYLLVGLLGPPTTSGMSVSKEYVPPLGTVEGRVLLFGSDWRNKDLFEYTAALASMISRNVLPAVALGVAVGWGLAWGVGKLPRGTRIIAYVVLALAFMPAAALHLNMAGAGSALLTEAIGFRIDRLPVSDFVRPFLEGQSVLQSYITRWRYSEVYLPVRVEYLFWCFQFVLVAALCTFLIATLLYRRWSQVKAPKRKLMAAMSERGDHVDDSRAVHTAAYVALSALVGLALGILLMTALISDLMPYHPRKQVSWYSWIPVASLLVALACIGVLVTRLFNFVRVRNRPRQPSESSGAKPRSLLLIMSAALATVFLIAAVSGLIAQLALAGAVCGVAIAELRKYGSRNTRNGEFILVSLALGASLVPAIVVIEWWLPSRVLPIELYILLVAAIVLVILWWWRGSKSMWYRLALNGIGLSVILVASYIAANPLDADLIVVRAYVVFFIGVGAGLAVLLSVRSRVQTGFDSIGWTAIVSFALLFLHVVERELTYNSFSLTGGGEWRLEGYSEFIKIDRLLLLFFGAFVVAYIWRVAIGSRIAPPSVQDQKSGWDWSSFLSSAGTAVGVAAASFAVVYGAAAILLSRTNFYQSAAYFQNGFLAKLEYEPVVAQLATGEWVYWINLCAFCLELIVIMGAGVFAYSRLTRAATPPCPNA